jgi:hypothetical protein
MASLANLPATADLILALFTAQLKAQGVHLPDRQYRQAGSQPVWDGEQLTTGLMGIAQGQPGLAYPQTFVPEALNLYATFFVLLIREIVVINTEGFTGMEIPTALEQDADGVALISDGAQLVIAASAIHLARSLVENGEGFVIDGLQPLGPEGGLSGSRLLLSVSLT